MADDPPVDLAEDTATLERERWRSGWRRFIFPSIWLVYLAQTAQGISQHNGLGWSIVGYVALLLFGVLYAVAINAGWNAHLDQFWMLFGAMTALVAVEAVLAHEDAFVMFVYLAVLVVAGARRAAPIPILAMALIGTFLPPLVPSWHAGPNYDMLVTIPLVALAMYGFFEIIKGNIALAQARSEVARLAAENERTRIARDLHDLLGHSLTTITVKAGLARRLSTRDPAAAATEIAEVEVLSRRSLAEVRAAVSGYREVTLAGEIATARAVLRASGISADFPGAVDTVLPELQELFGWVVREGVTNVVRHSRATRCTISFGPRAIRIEDDGVGGVPGAGNGLTGLRERVESAGGELQLLPGRGRGWAVAVSVPTGGNAAQSTIGQAVAPVGEPGPRTAP